MFHISEHFIRITSFTGSRTLAVMLDIFGTCSGVIADYVAPYSHLRAVWYNQYFSGGGDTSVAKVDGVEISQGQLQSATMQQRQRLEQMFGGKLPDMFSEEMIRSQVLQQLIEQEMLVQTASGNGMRIGDATLSQTITGIDAFKEDGKFSNSRYQQLLRGQGMLPGMFEQRVRRDLLASSYRWHQ